MSRSIIALGQHTLTLQDKKQFLKELSDRFNVNVYLGFATTYDWVKAELPTFDFLGIENPKADVPEMNVYLLDDELKMKHSKSLILLQDDYIYHWYYNKFGEQAGFQEEFIKHWSIDPAENNKIIKAYLDDPIQFDFYFENTSGTISLESAKVGLNEYFTDWINFYNLITRHENFQTIDWYQSLLNFRNTNKNTIQKLGGSCIYYFDDQGEFTGGIGQGNEIDMTWKDIETGFNYGTAAKNQINLCEALTNPDYLNLVQQKTKDHFHDFSVFYDDFRELTLDEIIIP